MFNLCIFCFAKKVTCKKPYRYLCNTCFKNLNEISFDCNKLKTMDQVEIIKNLPDYSSIYLYEGILRELILRAKVNNDFRALQFLRMTFLVNKKTEWLCTWATHIMPAPSSLWGRLRGKFDIAGDISFYLAKKYNKPLISPPIKLKWKLKKQAFNSKEKTDSFPTDPQFDEPSNFLQARKILLIDDITTTGKTFIRVKNELKADQIKFISLASAGQNKF